jgi:hypothetical protein
MESLLVHSDKHDFARLTRLKWVKWKFSTCAVAIDALGRLPSRSLENASSVVLHEDSIAVYGPECHFQGFVPLVAQNPRLRIKRRVKGYEAAYLSRRGSSAAMIDLKERSIQPTVYFRTLFSWIDDARILTSYGLTAKTYSLVFENDGDEVV